MRKAIFAILIGVILFIPGYLLVTKAWNPFDVPKVSEKVPQEHVPQGYVLVSREQITVPAYGLDKNMLIILTNESDVLPVLAYNTDDSSWYYMDANGVAGKASDDYMETTILSRKYTIVGEYGRAAPPGMHYDLYLKAGNVLVWGPDTFVVPMPPRAPGRSQYDIDHYMPITWHRTPSPSAPTSPSPPSGPPTP